ncbi:Bug family tripartite tricarboxylate transporter substrate binding protein [Cobetia amphilecti]|uniref:Bug family tripartite tricarboxylate transporter substrate binding protein n=1 Tax=Cobetia amphilecti TaxID=1055104 RepID=UPI001C092EF3|nr:tripartite tricarboxylate transporter substrate-binding protein [Cobetia amphilecti]MBU3009778.1 hypothetical protein [Cobetia amphilecti]
MFEFNYKTVAAVLLTLPTFIAPSVSHAEDWTPPGPITLKIGFVAGGGADTQARLIATEIEERTGWRIIPEQAVGKSGLTLAHDLQDDPADGTSIGAVVMETLTYNALLGGYRQLEYDHFTPLATTAAFRIGLVAMAGGELDSWEKIKQQAASGKTFRFGAATQRHADVAYHFAQKAGLDFNIVILDGGRAIMNGLRAGDLDLGWVAGPQAEAVQRGEMVNVVAAASTPLKESPDAPSIVSLGSDYSLDGYFLFIAPPDLPEAAREALISQIRAVVTDKQTAAGQMLDKVFGGAVVKSGAELDDVLKRTMDDSRQLLSSLEE